MIYRLALSIILLCSIARADIGVDAVTVLSNDLGYEQFGVGLQLDADGRFDSWGFDLQATALNNGKSNATGQRYQVIGMVRYFHGEAFVEAGIEWGGYSSEFPDGRNWTKYGSSVGLGVGVLHKDTEWTIRYFFPDSTPNETSVTSVSMEAPLVGAWVIGGNIEHWKFNENDSGVQAMLEVGYRF